LISTSSPPRRLVEELVVLADDGHAQVLLLHGGGRDADGVQQKPRRLIEARDVHARIHVAGKIVFRSQHRAFKRVHPFGHV
jgi:hypothetical protein